MSTAIDARHITFAPVCTPETIQTVAQLAIPIWREQFTPIIGPQQVAFMLQAWQSTTAIQEQIEQGSCYFLVLKPEEPIGYLAWIPQEDRHAKISKFYLLHKYHGWGYAKIMMQFLEDQATNESMKTLWLQVNRHNHRAIAFYRKCGFHTLHDRREEIAPGYFIDDHIMEKRLQKDA